MTTVSEGNRIRTYVLVALSLAGNANKNIKRSAKEAFKELDDMSREQKGVEITPVRPTSLNLLPVDNEEYKARRDAALQKPGAVIGQITIAN